MVVWRGARLASCETHFLTFTAKSFIIHGMNKSYSSPELYYKRWLTPHLQDALYDTSILVLTGARQVGKSTLLLNEAPFCDFRFLTLDDFDTLQQAQGDPKSLFIGADKIIIDEVQRDPDLLLAVKHIVDENPSRYKFVLSGSANLLLMKQVSESLAGRAICFELNPMTLGETNQVPPPSLIWDVLNGVWPEEGSYKDPLPKLPPLLLRGLMPSLLRLDNAHSWTRWWDGYVTTYLERDLRQLSQIDSLLDFRRLMILLALRSGQILNQSSLARDGELSQPTAHRYINLLETSYLFKRLPPFTSNCNLRLIKSPKAFWSDPGLVAFLSGYYEEGDLQESREFGQIFETFIFHHLQVITQLLTPKARLFYWRMRSGEEIDFVLEHGRKILPIEIKLTQKPGYDDAKHLRFFLENYKNADAGLLISCGKEIKRLGSNIMAVPWTMLTG